MESEGVDAPLLPKPRGLWELSEEEVRERNHYLDIAISILVPWVTFTVLVILFSYYHDIKILVWVYVYTFGIVGIGMMVLGVSARHGMFLLLGANVFGSIVFGAELGNYMNSEYLDYYNTLHNGQTYKDVDPSSKAGAKEDAGAIDFVPGTFVDDWRTLGYVTSTHIHCVAPVVKEGAYSNQVQYWATGLDCCMKRSNFDCGSAMDPKATKGIVARPSEIWSKAVAQAESVYNLNSSKDAIYLEFVENTGDAEDDIWADAVFTGLLADVMHLMVTMIIVYGIYQAMPNAMSPKGAEEFIYYYSRRVGPNLKSMTDAGVDEASKMGQKGMGMARRVTGMGGAADEV